MKQLLIAVLCVLIVGAGLTPGPAAASDTVSVLFPSLTDGQTVGGVVAVAVLVGAPEPITSVEYFVDNGLLGKLILAPYTYEWDTTQLTPGPHTLSVHAIDRAGNTGQAQVRLNIVPALDLVVSAPSDTVPIGEKIKLNVNVTALNPVARIDLIVDNLVVSSDQTPPFNLTLDTRDISPGQHLVTVRAIDDQGQLARASLPLQFQSPDNDYTWLRVLLVLGLLATISAAGFAVGRTIQVLRRSYQRTCRLELCNLGNVAARYEILADDMAHTLKFRLLLNGVAVPQEPLERPITRSIEPPPQATPQKPSPAAAPAPAQPSQVREKGRILADLAYTLGTILPGSVGQRLTEWGSTARNIDYTAQRAEYAGQQAQTLSGPKSTNAAATSAPVNVDPVSVVAVAPAPPPVPMLDITPGAWYTPYLQPGDVVALSLIVDPGHPKQPQHYTFRVSSRAIDPAQDTSLVENGQLQVAGVPLIKYYLPFFIIAGGMLGVLIVITLLLANTGALG